KAQGQSSFVCANARAALVRYQLAVLSDQQRKGVSPRFRLREIRILVRVRGRAAAEKAQWFCSHDGVPRAWRDEDRIASPDLATFTVELYLARAFEDEIKLLRHLVIMPLAETRASARLWFCTGAFVQSRIERIVEPSLVIKGGWAERFWTVILSKDAAIRRATEAQVSLATQRSFVLALERVNWGQSSLHGS